MVLQGGYGKGRDIGLVLVEDIMFHGGSRFAPLETFTQDERLHAPREILREFLNLDEGRYKGFRIDPWPFFRRDAIESLLPPEETVALQALLPALRIWRNSMWPSDLEADQMLKACAYALDGIIEVIEKSKEGACRLLASSWGS